MVDEAALEKVRNCITRGQRFVLTTHVNPDGDGLGSEAALSGFLKNLNKDVFIFNSSPVPRNYDFLNTDKDMIVYSSESHKEMLLTADYIVILDTSDWNRLRDVGQCVRDLRIHKICIDHHPPHDRFGDINLVNVAASSTGEIVYDLIRHCKGEITPQIAEALYTSILTDTGSFRFSNTNDRAFGIAGDLVKAGANSQKVYQKVYERESPNKVKLLGYVLYNLKLVQNGRIAWITIPRGILNELGAKPHDTEGFADYPRMIDGVEVSVMFMELDEGRVKVSLRSKGNYVVNTVAQKFGGGGHAFAAGILLEDGSLKEHAPRVMAEVAKLFN